MPYHKESNPGCLIVMLVIGWIFILCLATVLMIAG